MKYERWSGGTKLAASSFVIVHLFLRQLAKRGFTPREFSERNGRSPHDFLAVGHVGEHGTLRRNLHAVTNGEVTGETRLSCHHYIVAEHGGAGNSDLRDEETVPTDTDVVADLHEVVDLRSFADHGLTERGTVDCGSRPHLDVVLNANDADLRDLVMQAAKRGEAVAVRADDGAAVDDAAPADARGVVNGGVRVDRGPVADRRAWLDRHVGEDRHVVADDHVVADGHEGPDAHIPAQRGGGRDNRIPGDAFRRGPIGKPTGDDLRESEVDILDADEAGIIAFEAVPDEQRAGTRGRELRGVLRIAEKAELPGIRVGKRGHAGDDPIGRAFVTAADECGNFSDGYRSHERRAL